MSRTHAEKNAQIEQALTSNPQWTTKGLARELKVSEQLVGKVRKQLGIPTPVNTARQDITDALNNNPEWATGALAKHLGCSTGLVSKVKQELGLTAPPKSITDEEVQSLIEQANKGVPLASLARQFGITHHKATRLYHAKKLDMSNRITLPLPKSTGKFERYKPVFGR